MDRFISLLIVFLFVFPLEGRTQNEITFGSFPEAINFSVNDYKAAPQIWHGTQDKNGQLYFANNKGVITFDGNRWSRIQTPGQTPVTRLFRSADGTIYVGADNEIGILHKDLTGKIEILPLAEELLRQHTLGTIWNILERQSGDILFFGERGVLVKKNDNSFEVVLEIKKDKITTSQPFGKGILILLKNPEAIKDNVKLLYLPDHSYQFTAIPSPEATKLKNIRGTVQYNDTLVLFDERGKHITALQTGKSEFHWIPNQVVYDALHALKINKVESKGSLIYIATDNEGVVVYDRAGNIVRQFGPEEGMQNISVFELFFDNHNNLWCLLDNGISLIETSSPVTSFYKKQGITAATEAITRFMDTYLLATRTDLFMYENRGGLSLFTNSHLIREPTFGIRVFDTDFGKTCLIVGYNGIYELTKDLKKQTVQEGTYTWTIVQSKENKNVFYCGLDTPGGIGRLEKLDHTWTYTPLLTGVNGEVRSIVENNGNLYFSVKNKGVGIYNFRDSSVRFITEKPKQTGNDVYYICHFEDQLFAGTNNGLFRIEKDQFVPFSNIENKSLIQENLYVHRLYNANNQRLWMVLFYNEDMESEYREIGYLEKDAKNRWFWHHPPVTEIEEDVVHAIFSDQSGKTWFGGERGVYVLNENAIDNTTAEFPVFIRRVHSLDTLHKQSIELESPTPLSYHQNSLKIEFTSYLFTGTDKLQYRTKLEGLEESWSDWNSYGFVVYNKLREGRYQFFVQARDQYGRESKVTTYTFSILPPWYRTWWAYLLYLIGIASIIYLLIRVSLLRVKQQNQRLEDTVSERTQEIEKQKNRIETINRDLVDSIRYAKRLQNTILPDKEELDNLHTEHFVLYQPKDIVSGDFYWAEQLDDLFLFAAADCTGHGVPGAFVSIVGHNGIIRAINEFSLRKPNEILDKLREIVIESFKGQHQSEVKDGMDIALCSWNRSTKELLFAGANNSCVIIRNGEIIELKADKQPVGQYEYSSPFGLQSITLQDRDVIYLYTDGFIDQFGGPDAQNGGKKFKSKPFKELLTQIHHLPMDQQVIILKEKFESWKGNMEQIDDVCIFAVRV